MECEIINEIVKDVKQKLLTGENLMNLKDIVRLWHKTQMGNIHECRKNQLIFADIMWRLYEDMQPEIFDE